MSHWCIIVLVSWCLLIVSSQGKRCIDLDTRCKEWLENGECYRKEVKEKCRRSCKRCVAGERDYVMEALNRGNEDTRNVMYALICLAVFGVLLTIFKLMNTGAVCRSKGNMKGKTVVVTGGTSGIGLEIAFRLALRGAKIILGCPNLKRGFEAAKYLRKYTGQQYITVLKLNLSSFESVNEFAKTVTEEFSQVDVLVNNAGRLGGRQREESEDKNELTLQVNYLSHFLLTKLLLPMLKISSSGRIVNIVCDGYKDGTVNFQDFQMNRQFSNIGAYNKSKLALLLFTQHLSSILNTDDVTVNAVNPSRCSTKLWRHVFPYNLRVYQYAFEIYAYMFLKSVSQSAETLLYCCIEKDLQGVSGKLFEECSEVTVQHYDEEVTKKLWEVTERLIT